MASNMSLKTRDELLIYGYFRNEIKVSQIEIPPDIQRLVLSFHHPAAELLQFNDTVDSAISTYFTFNEAHTKATKHKEGGFYYVVLDLPKATDCTKGVHVFRFKIDHPTQKDLLWGISPFQTAVQPPSYSSPHVYGWQVYGQKCCGGKRTDDKRYNFMSKYSLILLDVRVDCECHTATFKPIKLEPIDNAESVQKMIDEEYVIDDLPLDITSSKGWVPHVQMYYTGSSVSVCYVDPELFGVYDENIDAMMP